MTTKFNIVWECLVTGHKGVDTKQLSHQQATRLAQRMNRADKKVHYSVTPVKGTK